MALGAILRGGDKLDVLPFELTTHHLPWNWERSGGEGESSQGRQES